MLLVTSSYAYPLATFSCKQNGNCYGKLYSFSYALVGEWRSGMAVSVILFSLFWPYQYLLLVLEETRNKWRKCCASYDFRYAQASCKIVYHVIYQNFHATCDLVDIYMQLRRRFEHLLGMDNVE